MLRAVEVNVVTGCERLVETAHSGVLLSAATAQQSQSSEGSQRGGKVRYVAKSNHCQSKKTDNGAEMPVVHNVPLNITHKRCRYCVALAIGSEGKITAGEA